MKILHYSLGFPPYRTGGLTKFCMDLMKEQVKEGHEVSLLWPGEIRLINMEYAEKATKEESIRKLSLPSNRPIILFFGQIKKVKGIDVLIEALSKVIKNHPEAYCVIAGKVWKDDFSAYQNRIDELGINDNIRTDIKFIPDDYIKCYFNAADIVALPYRQIYQSGVVLLAAAYEKLNG